MFPVSIEYIAPEKDDRNLVDPEIYKERMSHEIKASVAVKSEKLKLGRILHLDHNNIHSTISKNHRKD